MEMYVSVHTNLSVLCILLAAGDQEWKYYYI